MLINFKSFTLQKLINKLLFIITPIAINITYNTKINSNIPPNKLFSVNPLKTFISSNNFLALIKLNIYKKTKILNKTVKCLEGP